MAKILVIDDDPSVRNVIEQILKTQNHIVETASSGEVGISQALNFKPNPVICDITMVGIDGFETLKRFRTTHVASPV